jgi:hypothetical protein
MPNNDRTGPNGMGSQTGRGAGLCNGATNSAANNNQNGQRLGRRQGIGRGQKSQRAGGGQFRGIRQLDNSPTSSELGLQQQIQDLQKQLETLSEALVK